MGAIARATARVPFNVADAVEAHFDQPHEPQTIHFELQLHGTRLDHDRLVRKVENLLEVRA